MRSARLILLSFAALGGCSAKDQPPSADSKTTSPQPAPLAAVAAVFEENATWSREESLDKLSDERERLAAAVRLVRLAGLTPLCLPLPLPRTFADALRIASLGKSGWALGVGEEGDDRRLRMPVLIDPDGAVSLPADGLDEELAVLVVSKEARYFPHVLVLPDRVQMISEARVTCLAGKSLPGCRFDVRTLDHSPRVVLLWRGADAASQPAGVEPRIVAEYRWDVYESVFAGPEADELPGAGGLFFALDSDSSGAFLPVGGRTPPPATVIVSQPRPAEQDDPH